MRIAFGYAPGTKEVLARIVRFLHNQFEATTRNFKAGENRRRTLIFESVTMTINPVRQELPDPKVCRTSPVGGVKTFGTCHVATPYNCEYAIGFGYGYYCKHPHWKDLVRP
jgi:hypothetical protein